ncbi:Ankyrin repeat and SOCS box protein 6 [Dissostichus eleginoides]|uniref:Ankyrin repeat and SOCS box protein 6 n=1 Tax=Dissostichus eleginoides TaxID=100907 RepID=A0AAD9BY83_DISEL|nr:Ankyrin repeat and SOCS box protein 6 [Dissostichus eleginoides]
MPFLHGFRRIIYEYKPLVDAVMSVVGLLEGGGSHEDRVRSPEGESAPCSSLAELLERESQSEVFVEGISCSLSKVAEHGLVDAAEILLRYGADLNFEDPVSYYNPLHMAVLRNKPDMVRLLVRHGADVEKRDRIHESSPLDLASEELEGCPACSSFWSSVLMSMQGINMEKPLCSMPLQAATDSLCTTQRTLSFFFREALT